MWFNRSFNNIDVFFKDHNDMNIQASNLHASPLTDAEGFITVEKSKKKKKQTSNIHLSENNKLVAEKITQVTTAEFPKLEKALTTDEYLNTIIKQRKPVRDYVKIPDLNAVNELRTKKTPSDTPRIIDSADNKEEMLVEEVAKKVLFSQSSVSDAASDGQTANAISIDELAERMFKQGFDSKYPLDIVQVSEDTFSSLDNRRLLIAKKIKKFCEDYKVWVRVHGYDEPLSRINRQRFRALTWGQALELRTYSSRMSNSNGSKKHPTIKMMGGVNIGGQKREQSLSFSLSDREIERLTAQGYNREKMIESMKIVDGRKKISI